MFRLFVGLELSPELRAALGGLCAGVPGARWVDDENLHVTLRFVGEVDAHLADDLAEELRFLRAPAFGLRLAGVDRSSPIRPWSICATRSRAFACASVSPPKAGASPRM
jgi:2'-5' RNA ligase